MYWKLTRPKPALPNSYFWTWDHSTNWVLDDPGILNLGCQNRYLKRPETFVEDYRRLSDFAAGLGVNGIVIWGFLRDSHGGIESAKRVAGYAADKNVAIMPGIGTTFYGGVYYEGSHKYCLENFLEKHPEARMINKDGNVHLEGLTNSGWKQYGACPNHPVYLEWLQESIQWLFHEFTIGGANIENGDYLVCHDPRCEQRRADWPREDSDFLRLQAFTYVPAFECIRERLKNNLITAATYCGFMPGDPPDGNYRSLAWMRCQRPAMLDRMPQDGIIQWTISGIWSVKSLFR